MLRIGLLLLLAAGTARGIAEEGRAGLFVVDRSFDANYVAYPPSGGGGEREIHCVAEGPPGTTILAVAFDGDEPYEGLAPVVAPQGAGSGPLRFPGGEAIWSLRAGEPTVDLYVAVFADDDPQLPWFVEYAGHLEKALASGDRDAALLHSIAIRYRFSAILRQRSEDEFRVAFPAADEPRRPSSPIAGVTRGGAGKGAGLSGGAGAVFSSKELSRFDDEWREESRAITFSPTSPGILIFPVAPPSAP